MSIPRRILGDKTNAARHADDLKRRRAEEDPLQRPLKFFKLDTDKQGKVAPASKPIAPSKSRPPRPLDLQPFSHHRLLNQLASGQLRPHHTMPFSSRFQLTHFVSSNTTDVYKLFSSTSSFALPTCCSYSNAAKKGAKPLLAVGTELGAVELMETPKRKGWEFAPQRTSIGITNNMIFDVKWRCDDELLAVATADRVVYLVNPSSPHSPATQLHGLVGSAKVLAWDPNHPSLLSAASRQGEIFIWDIRESNRDSDDGILPCLRIQDLDKRPASVKQPKSKKPVPRSVTSLIYHPIEANRLISSGANNGILKKWDTRFAIEDVPVSSWQLEPTEKSLFDPTLSCGSKRSRGISSLAIGEGAIYGLGCDSRIHEYPLQLATPFLHDQDHSFGHAQMRINSFYTRLTTSPCGKWLACGSTDGSIFLYDKQSTHPLARQAVRLRGHEKEVGGLDWAASSIATCSDDRTIRIWHPDNETLQECLADPEKNQWDWKWRTE